MVPDLFALKAMRCTPHTLVLYHFFIPPSPSLLQGCKQTSPAMACLLTPTGGKAFATVESITLSEASQFACLLISIGGHPKMGGLVCC